MSALSLVVLHAARGLVELSESAVGTAATALALRTNRVLSRRNRERPRERARWFTAGEAALVEVLAGLIVPSGESGPGAEQLRERGPSVADTVDQLVAGSPPRQALYARGLLALERLASAQSRAGFIHLSPAAQERLLQALDELGQRWSGPRTLTAKLTTRLATAYHKWSGLYAAVALFPVLVEDVHRAFYTSPVSWEWLGYDGPPMPAGYPAAGAT